MNKSFHVLIKQLHKVNRTTFYRTSCNILSTRGLMIQCHLFPAYTLFDGISFSLSHLLNWPLIISNNNNNNFYFINLIINFLSGSAGDKSVIVWSPTTGKLITRLEGHTRYVTCCAFSYDGSILATGSNDKTVMLWSIDSLTPALIDRRISISRELAGSILNSNDLFDVNTNLPSNGGPIDLTVSNCATVATWTVKDVIEWLANLGLPQYENIFQEHQIDGSELLHLTHDSLLTVLKIETLGHRNKILRAVQGLRNPLWQHISLVNEENISLPQELLCPITHEFMREPVVASDGYSYEKDAISKWISSGNTTSPMTNEPLNDLNLVPNKTLSLLIKKYLAP